MPIRNVWNKLQKTGEDKMTNNVPGIGINPGSVNPYLGQAPKDDNPKTGNEPTANAPQAPTQPQVAPDAVFAYMAGSAPVTLPPTYDVGKYVTPDQAARIAAMMGEFEGAVQAGLLAIETEGLPLTEADKLALAAAMVD